MPDIQTTLPRTAGKTLGQSGTMIQHGFITGEEYNRDLTGKQGLRIYDIMRRSDSTVRRTLQICKLPILSSSKEIEPASDDPEDIFRANFVKRELFNRNVKYHKFEREALSMFDFGHSLFEKTYELTVYEGRTLIGIKAIDSRKQTSIYSWETREKTAGITQIVADAMISIPRNRLVVFTHDQEGENWEGMSLLRSAYKDWNIKDKLLIINAIAMEKMALGIPIIKRDGSLNVSPAEVAKVRSALRQIRANEEAYLEVPNGLIVEMLDLKTNETKDVMPTVKYHDRQIVGSVLAQFTELGSDSGSGSRALSSDQSDLFMKSEEAADHILVDAIQEDIIKQLCDLNFSDNEARGYPRLKGGNISDQDISTMAESISKLLTSHAVTATVETEQHIRKILKLPELTEDDVKEYDEKQAQARETSSARNKPKPPIINDDESLEKTTSKPADKKDKADLKAANVLANSLEFRRQINVIFAD